MSEPPVSPPEPPAPPGAELPPVAAPAPAPATPLLPPPLPAQAAAVGPAVILNDQIEIFPAMPLPYLHNGAGHAYAARLKGDNKFNFYALVGSQKLPARYDFFGRALALDTPNFVKLRDIGVVNWPGGDLPAGNKICYIFTRPLLPSLAQQQASGALPPLDEKQIAKVLLEPAVRTLRDLTIAGIPHGNLHLANIFGQDKTTPVVLGECLTTPPSFDQHASYLTAERAQCLPAARGTPEHGDDVYALGVCALALAIGRVPLADLSTAEIVRLKLEKGSFGALLSETRVAGGLVELLRGTLDDNIKRRWSLSDLEQWLNGRRPPAKPNEAEARPNRPFTFNGQQANTLRGAVNLLCQDSNGAAANIEAGDIKRWVGRSLGMETLAQNLEDLTLKLKPATGLSRTAVQNEQLVTRAAILLDPQGPLRYRGVSVMPSGFAFLLGTTLSQNGNPQILAEILQANLLGTWVDAQGENKAAYTATQQKLERAKFWLDRRTPGFGLERVLYELVPGQACLSPLIASAEARTVTEALQALDALGNNGTREPLDRHLAAFLYARERKIPEQLLQVLTLPETKPERAIGIVAILAEAQARTNAPNLKNLAGWAVTLLEPALKRFHEVALRARLSTQLKKLAETGDLAALVNLVDDPKLVVADFQNYSEARTVYSRAKQAIAQLQQDLANKHGLEARVGQPTAMGLAVLLGFAGIIVALMQGVLGI